MSSSNRCVWQVVPKLPGGHDGVGDYASKLAQRLQADCGIETRFVAPPFETETKIGFQNGADTILHYVNYGYQRRGVPTRLPSLVHRWKQKTGGHLLTVFHELYASGPPWRSAFWLQHLQKSIVHEIGHVSDGCIVSSETLKLILDGIVPGRDIRVHPVFSNFGEPSLSADQIAGRSSNRWVVCGGTRLVERSLRSFCQRIDQIPELFSPRELLVLGGRENPTVRSLLRDLTDIRSEYRPEVTSAEASQILSLCSFAWLDYFDRADVPGEVLLKSSAFAAACAHGVIPVLPHPASAIGLAGDRLPGPYFINHNTVELPLERSQAGMEIYQWYQRCAASGHLARGVAEMLSLTQ